MKLSKTEKMTCLIRPWKWNSINRSLKSKKCGCQEKRAKSHQSFYHNRKTQSLLYIYIACINHWYIVRIWLEFVWLASFLKHYSTISTFFLFATQLKHKLYMYYALLYKSIQYIEFVHVLELFYIVQNKWKVCWNIAIFYKFNNECIKTSWIFFIHWKG